MRYRLPLDRSYLGQRIIDGMSRVKLDMLRFTDSDGDAHVWADYEVCGTLRVSNGDGGDGMAVLQELFREMLDGRPPEKMPMDGDEEGGAS